MTTPKIPFYKMSGSGNDFILVDNRERIVDEKGLSRWVSRVCRRRQAVGADGLILIEPSLEADFKWRFFNSDGGQVEMCGNGGRCVARLAHFLGIAGADLSFETVAGVIRAEVKGKRVKLEMPRPSGAMTDYMIDVGGKEVLVDSIVVGVPHVVIRVADIEQAPVLPMGREIRYHHRYAPAGTNVNFVQIGDDGSLLIRTYERGVEDETLACGTGSVASALMASLKNKTVSPATVLTRGGEVLDIHFQRREDDFFEVFLEGDTTVVYQGALWDEAVEYSDKEEKSEC